MIVGRKKPFINTRLKPKRLGRTSNLYSQSEAYLERFVFSNPDGFLLRPIQSLEVQLYPCRVYQVEKQKLFSGTEKSQKWPRGFQLWKPENSRSFIQHPRSAKRCHKFTTLIFQSSHFSGVFWSCSYLTQILRKTVLF